MTVLAGLDVAGMGRLACGRWRRSAVVGLGVVLVLVLNGAACLAMQRHDLLASEQSTGEISRTQSLAQPSDAAHAAPVATSVDLSTNAAATTSHSASSAPAAQGQTRNATLPEATATERKRESTAPSTVMPKGEEERLAPPAGSSVAEHGGGAAEQLGQRAAHGEHGVVLPQISPIPGVTFVETEIDLMEYELHGRFLGWRPNDLIIGRFTDNINNYQLGVLEAIRFTTMRLKDSLTRMGEADTYDRDLEDALNLFMNKATLFWFPSAEGSYSEAVDHLRAFLAKLKTGRRSFYYRVDNLLSLVASYGDLLGNVNKSLAVQVNPDGTPVSWFASDDYFYYAKGVAHVIYEILKVVRVGFKDQLITLDAVDIMDEILHELHTAEKMDPWIILNSDLDGFFANHRANLNAPLSEVAHLMVVLSRF